MCMCVHLILCSHAYAVHVLYLFIPDNCPISVHGEDNNLFCVIFERCYGCMVSRYPEEGRDAGQKASRTQVVRPGTIPIQQ